ncbi:MAG: hypothetical protein EBS54_06815, partial [Betaproteobacteria bacterium]|nr:hypothetical protein [Betaproteobacteria bacterium]
MANDPRSYVYSGGFRNADPKSYTADPVGFTETGDIAIGLVFELGAIPENGSVDLSYKTILSASAAETLMIDIAISSNKTSLKAGDTATVTFILSTSSSDFTASDVTVTGGTLSALSGSGTTYTATFTPDANSTTPGVVSVASGVFSDAA